MDDDLRDWVGNVIAQMSEPVSLCLCSPPVLVKSPNEMDWCACHRCGGSVPYTAVVEGQATITDRLH